MRKRLKNSILSIIILGSIVIVIFLQSTITFTTRLLPEDSDHFRKYVVNSLARNETTIVPFKLTPKWLIEPRVNFSSTHLQVLILITSKIDNFNQRQFIRETWGNQKIHQITRLKVLFLLGATKNRTIQKVVEAEATANMDILQTEFIDSYRNLTYKIATSLSWAMQHGRNLSWFAKIDDDVLVNPFQMSKFLNSTLKASGENTLNTIYGRLRRSSKPFRKGKYKVTVREYPYTIYPPLILGSAYFLSHRALNNIVKHMQNTQFLYLEDVFVTGLVAHKAKVSLKNIEKEHYIKKIGAQFIRGKKFFCVACNFTEARSAWDKILNVFKERPN